MSLSLPDDNWIEFDIELPPGPAPFVTPDGHAVVPSLECQLWAESSGGKREAYGTGYFQREERDCLRASLATYFQIPWEKVPDTSMLRGQYDVMAEFVDGLGYEFTHVGTQEGFPNPAPVDDFWIGSLVDSHISEESHAVVLWGRKVVFDPAWGFQMAGVGEERPYLIQQGKAFKPKEK